MRNRSRRKLFAGNGSSRWLLLMALWATPLTGIDASPLTEASYSVQQQGRIKVQGTVMDSNGDPIIGANVKVEGSTTGTITDLDGKFNIQAKPGAKLQVSFIGYETKTVKIGKGELKVTLNEDSQMLAEVEVVAYGAQKKATLTGAIASVKAADLTQTAMSSVTQALAGQMTGISSVQYSGEPGADGANLLIRGKASFNDASPLIQLDGVVMEEGTVNINDIDPEEIESISILKDASATAVFGVRGANGVILITTKRGQEGKAKISVNVSGSILRPNRPVEMANSYEYANFHNMMRTNDGQEPQFSDALIEKFRTNSDPLLYPSTDWPTYIMKDFSTQTKANVNISGGNKRARYFFSAGMFKQGGLFKDFDMPYDYNYDYQRFNYRSNLDLNVTPTTLVSMNISGSMDTSTKPNIGGASNDVFKGLYVSAPFASPGIVDGKYIITTDNYDSDVQLPFTGEYGFANYYGKGYQNNSQNTMALQASVKQDLKMITKGLSFEIKGAYNSSFSIAKTGTCEVPIYRPRIIREEVTLPDGTVATQDKVVLTKEGQEGEPTYTTKSGRARNWYFDARFNYSRTFGSHTVSALLLYNQSKRYYPSSYSDIPTGYVGLVGRVTYDWKNRYMAEFNVGYNGSENFAPERRFGTFPAGSVGYAISEEPFFKPLKKVIEYMKFRASWGLVGSDKGVTRFFYTPDVYVLSSGLYGAGGGYGYNFGIENSTVLTGAYESIKHNPNVGWEKSFKQNYGVDINFFNNKLKTTFDYYKEHRTDILLTDYTAPSLIGFKVPSANLGAVDSWGWEVSAKWNDKIGSKFRYWVGVNLSYNQNEIIEKKEAPANNAYQYEKGHRIGSVPMFQFFEYYNENTPAHYKEVFGQDYPEQLIELKPGDCVYVDLDHNGVIDSNDQSRELSFTEDPEYTIGMNFGFSWKNLEVNTQWTGAWNVMRILQGTFRRPFYSTNNTEYGGLLKYHIGNTWTEDNPSQSAKYPRVSTESGSNNYDYNSTLWAQDAKYLRLKTLQIAYNFKFPLMKTLGMKTFQLSLSGYNLLTFTPFIWGDPETRVNVAPSYPLQRTYTLTAKIGF